VLSSELGDMGHQIGIEADIVTELLGVQSSRRRALPRGAEMGSSRIQSDRRARLCRWTAARYPFAGIGGMKQQDAAYFLDSISI
jgi:hypothetical protein